MKFQLTVHEQYKEIDVHVFTDAYTDEVEQLMKTLKSPKATIISFRPAKVRIRTGNGQGLRKR